MGPPPWDDVTEKDTCTIDLTGPEKDFWMGSEAGMLGCYWFRGVVFAGDGSDPIIEAEWGRELFA